MKIELDESTIAVLLAGLYTVNTGVNPIAIPESLWLDIVKILSPYLETWDYKKMSFEEFVRQNLLIIPKQLCTEEDIDYYKQNTVYFEYPNGNVILVVTFNIEV